MDYNDYRLAVYDLAEFNSTLTKGYGKNWSDRDCSGYVYKNNELSRLVGIAIERGYPVYRSGYVVYFIFGQVQISFHVKSDFGLAHSGIKWDGILEAYKYSEEEYVRLRDYRACELAKRLELMRLLKIDVIEYSNKRLKRIRRSIDATRVSFMINKEDISGLIEYFGYKRDMLYMFKDSYIHNFGV